MDCSTDSFVALAFVLSVQISTQRRALDLVGASESVLDHSENYWMRPAACSSGIPDSCFPCLGFMPFCLQHPSPPPPLCSRVYEHSGYMYIVCVCICTHIYDIYVCYVCICTCMCLCVVVVLRIKPERYFSAELHPKPFFIFKQDLAELPSLSLNLQFS